MRTTVLTLTALLSWLLLACESATPEPAQATSEPAIEAPADGRVSVQVGAYGYTPATVGAPAGKPLTLIFTRASEEGCGGELVFPERNIRKTLPVGEPVEVTFTPDQAGRIAFTCGMGMYEGAILVSEGS